MRKACDGIAKQASVPLARKQGSGLYEQALLMVDFGRRPEMGMSRQCLG